MIKPVYEVGQVLRVEDNFDLTTGTVTVPTTRFVMVKENTKKGTPIVVPLSTMNNLPIIPLVDLEQAHQYYKSMHWSKKTTSWQVYGHPVTTFP